MQCGESFAIALIHLSAVVQQVMDLKRSCVWALAEVMEAHHVELLVGGGEMNGRSAAVVLCDEVSIRLHNLRQLFGIAQTGARIESKGRISWGCWISTASCEIARHCRVSKHTQYESSRSKIRRRTMAICMSCSTEQMHRHISPINQQQTIFLNLDAENVHLLYASTLINCPKHDNTIRC